MNRHVSKYFGVMALLAAILFSVAGCESVSLESNKDKTAVRKVERLYILIAQSEAMRKPLASSLATAFARCFTNLTPQIEIAVASPLDLDDAAYKSHIKDFDADAVLVVSVRSFIMDQYGGYPTLIYDASLFNPTPQKRIWRASINSSGGGAWMDHRMQQIADRIVQQLSRDGFL